MQTRAPAQWIAIVLSLAALVRLALPAHAAADVGYPSLDYVGASAPTGQKPQSKLWVVGDTWFASLYNVLTTDFELYRLDRATHTWRSTGTLIDERTRSAADVVWDGRRLYALSASTSTTTAGPIRLTRYSYDSSTRTFRADPGFPVTITTAIVETVVLDEDTTGRLWLTFTEGDKVYVAHTTSDDLTWTSPFVLPVAGATNIDPDDISALVAYGQRIGVMWSNQVDSAMYFASHRDGDPDSSWTSNPAIEEAGYADDHINLKALDDDPSGQVFAATKTSLNDSASSGPLVLLLVLGNDGTWRRYPFGTVADDHTRPIVAIDRQNRRIYEFATAPCCSGGAVYYKQTSLDGPSFPPGLGTPFLQSLTSHNINNPTTTKQELSGDTDLAVMASDDQTDLYWYGILDLPDAAPPSLPGRPGPAPFSLPAARDATRPVLSALRLRPRAFRAGRPRPAGSTVRYRLTEPATVEFTVERARSHGGYRRLTGSLTEPGRRGADRFRFSGRLRGRRLRPGRYRLAAVPTDAVGNRGRTVRAGFRILPRRGS
jgi:hypothetical protein